MTWAMVGPEPRFAEGGAGGGNVQAAPTRASGARTNYTPTTIDALAANMAATPGLLKRPGASYGTRLTASDAAAAQSCVEDQTRDGTQPLSLVLARFEGRPAFVEVFRVGSPGAGSVRVVVADRDTCAVLYTTSHTIPPG